MEENQVQNGAKISFSVTEEERIPAEEDKSKRKGNFFNVFQQSENNEIRKKKYWKSRKRKKTTEESLSSLPNFYWISWKRCLSYLFIFFKKCF